MRKDTGGSWGSCGYRGERPGAARGMGHVPVACNSCYDEFGQTVFFEPPHRSGCQSLAGWVTGPGPQP
jgi:hypothetical protein